MHLTGWRKLAGSIKGRLTGSGDGYPRWEKIFENDWKRWQAELHKKGGGRKILLATAVGSQRHTATLESMLAVGLTLRGAEVHAVLCDGKLPACFACNITNSGNEKDELTRNICSHCFRPAERMFETLGITLNTFGENMTVEDEHRADDLSRELSLDEIKSYVEDGVALGEHALAGALRYFARGTLEDEGSERVLRQYFKAALITKVVFERLMDSNKYECVVFAHGIYVPHGIIGEVCRRKGIRVVNWVPSYRKKTFIFSHGDTYHHTLMNEPVEKWQQVAFGKKEEKLLMDYLNKRWSGKEDWIWFSAANKEFNKKEIERLTGIDFNKPCVGMLTNVVWDAQLHYPANVFANMMEWIIETIRYFEKRQDLQLVIRIHPAEVTSSLPSRQRVADEIKRYFPVLSKNIHIISPESPMNTYFLMSQCDTTIIYGTKTGVELTSMGIPVIVAGEAWIRNKGISIDPKSKDEYFNLLSSLPCKRRLNETEIKRARTYAYHFFFRRMMPVDCITVKDKLNFEVGVKALSGIAPGRMKGFDVICDGIMNNEDFIYKHEVYHEGKDSL